MSRIEDQRHWDEVFRAKAEDDVSWFESCPTRSLDLIARTGLPKSAAIIDIGGGLSRLADTLAGAGYTDVTVLDISREAVRRLGERPGFVARTRLIAVDVKAWRPERAYDIWHDRAVLHFLTGEDDRAAYRNVLLSALTPGGQAIIATFALSGPERCSGLPVRRYGAEGLAKFLGKDFILAESFEFDHLTPAGASQRFLMGRFVRR